MSKMGQIAAEMDEKNIPEDKRNSLIDRVSAGMHSAEKRIDFAIKSDGIKEEVKVETKKPSQKVEASEFQDVLAMDVLTKKIRMFADKTHNVITLNGKSYVKAGVYQYLANLLHITPEFDFEPESTQTEVWCTCILRNAKGDRVTHATMYADKREVFLRDKEDFAVIGMAQTRAFVRAMKNVYGFLIEYAGYQSIAIEEIGKEKNNG